LEYGGGNIILMLPVSLVTTLAVEVEVEAEVAVTSVGLSSVSPIPHGIAPTHEQMRPKVPIIFVSTPRILRIAKTRYPATIMTGRTAK